MQNLTFKCDNEIVLECKANYIPEEGNYVLIGRIPRLVLSVSLIYDKDGFQGAIVQVGF